MFFVFLAWCIITEALFPLYATVFLLIISLTSEGILKNIFREPRPAESAVESYGMPSSHCMTSYAVMVWTLPYLANADVSPPIKVPSMILLALLLAPVPWARYALGDHSAKQCVAGCVGGIVCGLFVFVYCTTTSSFSAKASL